MMSTTPTPRRAGLRPLATAASIAVLLVAGACTDPGTPSTSTTPPSSTPTSSTVPSSSTTEPSVTTTTESTTTSTVPTTSVPNGSVTLSGSCDDGVVRPGGDVMIPIAIAGFGEGQDHEQFEVHSIDVDLAWSGVANQDIVLGISSPEDTFYGLTAGGAGAGGDVEFRDDASVLVTDLPSAGGLGLVGRGRPLELLAAARGAEVGSGEPGSQWALVGLNIDEDAAATIDSCRLSIVASPRA